MSVVVPTIAGREHWLERCVRAYEETVPGVEVIVVTGKPSCGAAWEEGQERATGDYVHFTADDLVPLPGWFEAAAEVCDAGAIPAANVLTEEAGGEWLPSSTMYAQAYLLGDGQTENVLVPFFSRAQFEIDDGDSWVCPIHYGSDDWVTFLADRRGIPTRFTHGYLFGHGAAPEGRLHQSRPVDIPILCDRMSAWGPVPTVYRNMGVYYGWRDPNPAAAPVRGAPVQPIRAYLPGKPLLDMDDGYYWNGPRVAAAVWNGPRMPGDPPLEETPAPTPTRRRRRRQGGPRVWSGSQFKDELDVLEIRLGTIGHLVDRFVLVEATVDQRGRPKPLAFEQHQERFAPWLDKIEYVVVDDMPTGDSREQSWVRERFQRDAILRGMPDLAPDDLVLVSDLDEIPSPAALEDALQRPPVRFLMDLHVYRLNWRWTDRNEQIATLASVHTGAEYLAAGAVNPVALTVPQVVRPSSGWHLTYQGSIEQLRAKMTGMADAFYEDLVPEAAKAGVSGPADFLTDEWIQGSIDTGRDIYARDYRASEWVDLDQLPPYVEENLERFAHMLVPNPALAAAA